MPTSRVRRPERFPTFIEAILVTHAGRPRTILFAEFLGDYNYAAATNDYAAAVWNDVRQAADCPAVDAYRAAFVQFVTGGQGPSADEDVADVRRDACRDQTWPFGNSDIWGGSYGDPTP